MQSIESPQNETFKRLKTLLESKGIKKEGLFMVFGQKPIVETLRTSGPHARYILATQDMADEAHRLHRFLHDKGNTLFLAPALFEELNVFGISYPILVCEAPQWPTWQEGVQEPSLVCPFQNPQNLGGALRSALAFGFRVILTKESAHPLHPKCIRAVSGNIFEHKIVLGPSVRELQPSAQLVVIDQGGDDCAKFRFPKNAVLVVGEEGQGVPEQLKSAPRASIAISPKQESLNAMAALSIAAFAYRSQHPLT